MEWLKDNKFMITFYNLLNRVDGLPKDCEFTVNISLQRRMLLLATKLG